MRFERVQNFLEADPTLRERLGPKDHPVNNRSQEKHFFSKGVVAVTLTLHEKGLDAHTANKFTILEIAQEVLKSNGEIKMLSLKIEPDKNGAEEQAPAPVVLVTEPAPVPAVPATGLPAPPIKRKRGRPPKPKPPLEVAVKPEQAPVPTTQVQTPPPEKLPQALPESAHPPLSPQPRTDVQLPVFYPFPVVFAQLAAAYNILQMADNQPGADQRQAKLDSLIVDVLNLKDIAVPLPPAMTPPSLARS